MGWCVFCPHTLSLITVLNCTLKCRKSYSEETAFTQSWTTEHGFDLSVTTGASFTADFLFGEMTTSLEISFGYSFTSSYTKSKKLGVSEEFSVETDVPPGAKLEIRFFKSSIPVSVKWRASLFAQGYVLVAFVDPVTGYPLMDKPKLLHLAQLLSYDERRLFAFGTIDYGKRTTLISRSKIVDQDGNVISSKEEDKPVNTGIDNP